MRHIITFAMTGLILTACQANQPIIEPEGYYYDMRGEWQASFSNADYTAALNRLTLSRTLVGNGFQADMAYDASGAAAAAVQGKPYATGDATVGNITLNFQSKADAVNLSCEGAFRKADNTYSGTCTRAITGEKVSLSMKKLS